MLVGVIADSHDHMERIKQAIHILGQRQITTVIHAGDYIAPFALIPFVEAGFGFYAVFGNNDGEIEGLRRMAEPIGGIRTGPYRFEIDGKKFLLNHVPLSDEQLAAERSRSDFVIVGHTHIVEHRRLGDLSIINPGELCGWLKGRATFAILNVASGELDLVDL